MRDIIVKSLLMAGGIMAVVLLTVFVRPAPPADNASAADPGNSLLVSNETSYNFGTISMAGGKVTRRFVISNPTDQPITISKVFSSCMCTKVGLNNGASRQGPFGMPGHGGAIPAIQEVIRPGAQAEVEVIYDPAAHGPAGVGKFERYATIQTGDDRALRLFIRGFVTP